MNDQATLIDRIGSWFKSATRLENDPIGRANQDAAPAVTAVVRATEHRSTFLRPWAKRDQAIENVQGGLASLSDLMGSIRDNMERQSKRQDELLQYLSHLPQALQALPESSRLQAETLSTIQQQMNAQSAHQQKLGEILEKLGETGSVHGKALETVQDHVEAMRGHDEKISQNLGNVGSAMETVSEHSKTSTQVLQQMRDNINARDGELQRLLAKQGSRFTAMLVIAIILSIVALGAVGYLAFMTLQLKH